MGLENKGRAFGREEATGNVSGAGKGKVEKDTGEGVSQEGESPGSLLLKVLRVEILQEVPGEDLNKMFSSFLGASFQVCVLH